MNNKAQILIDADVLIHLFKADKITLLNDLYRGRLKMLDIVLNELRSNRTINSALDSIFLFSGIEELFFDTADKKMFFEYIELENKIDGKGERATLVYCKHNNDIIASSNTRDITPFCNEHGISFLTTLDIIYIAVYRKFLTKNEANTIIGTIHSRGSFLCCRDIDTHFTKHFDNTKLLY